MRAILLLTLAACEFHATATGTADSGVVTGDTRSPDGSSFTPCAGYVSLGPTLEPSSYRVVTTPARFKIAEQSCEATLGHLVILDDDVESTAVAAMSPNGWVGFSDLKNDNTWIDVAGRPSSYMDAQWAATEPSSGGNDNCASLIGVASLNAANCDSKDGAESDMRGYVCECGDGVQDNPNNFQRPE